MKKLLFILGFSCIAGSINAQEVFDANHVLKGYITKEGVVQDKNANTLCSFLLDGRIVDPKSNVVGYVVNEYELQDKNHKTIGFILPDCTVEDANHKLIATISKRGSGPITDTKNNILGYIDAIEPMRAAAYFFLMKY